MQIKNLLFFLCFIACKNTTDEKFDKIKWAIKRDNEYPHRDKMLNDLIANYKLKGLKKEEVVELLGAPNRTDNGHLFYTIAQETLANILPLHTKTMVIKLTKDSTVEWRKIHE
jgi:hypothetical protein